MADGFVEVPELAKIGALATSQIGAAANCVDRLFRNIFDTEPAENKPNDSSRQPNTIRSSATFRNRERARKPPGLLARFLFQTVKEFQNVITS